MNVDKNSTDINDLSAKVLEGVRKALRKLAEGAAAKNENLIIGDKNGNVQSVPAKDLLNTLPEFQTLSHKVCKLKS